MPYYLWTFSVRSIVKIGLLALFFFWDFPPLAFLFILLFLKGKAGWISSAILVFIYKLSGCLSEFLFSSKLNRNKVTVTFPSWLWRQVSKRRRQNIKALLVSELSIIYFSPPTSLWMYIHLSKIKTSRLPTRAGARI